MSAPKDHGHTLPTALATATVASSPAKSATEDPAAAAPAPPERNSPQLQGVAVVRSCQARTRGKLEGLGTVLPLQLVRAGAVT